MMDVTAWMQPLPWALLQVALARHHWGLCLPKDKMVSRSTVQLDFASNAKNDMDSATARLCVTLRGPAAVLSYRAMLAAIVSLNSLVLVSMGIVQFVLRYVAIWGIAQVCLCETKYYLHHLGECFATSGPMFQTIWDAHYKHFLLACHFGKDAGYHWRKVATWQRRSGLGNLWWSACW